MALSNSKVGTNTSTPFIASAKPKAADLLRIETRKEQCELHGEFVSERFRTHLVPMPRVRGRIQATAREGRSRTENHRATRLRWHPAALCN